MIRLGVNIDHVATLRQARHTPYPDLNEAALLAEQSGADLITLHLREDRRHIQDKDVYTLRKQLKTAMNLEMAVTEGMIAIALEVHPPHVCLVPEKRAELTTEGGLDLSTHAKAIRQACEQLATAGIAVSLFIDPTIESIEHSQQLGAPIVELHTGRFAETRDPTATRQELQRVITAAERGQALGLQVHAGHGLHYHNVQPIARIAAIEELNIGHAIVARALFIGWSNAVQEMKQVMLQARAAG